MTKNNDFKEAVKSDTPCPNCNHNRYWNTNNKCTRCGFNR